MGLETMGQMGLDALIRSDKKRYLEAGEALTKLGFYASFLYRLSRHFSGKGWLFVARLLQFVNHVVTGAEISHRALIGPGLALLHPTGVMIGPKVKIGHTATICQGCTICQNMDLKEEGPEIGNYFWAGANSTVMGTITVGDHVWVGPNAALFKKVAAHMTVIGNPARAVPTDVYRQDTPSPGTK